MSVAVDPKLQTTPAARRPTELTALLRSAVGRIVFLLAHGYSRSVRTEWRAGMASDAASTAAALHVRLRSPEAASFARRVELFRHKGLLIYFT